MKLLTANRLNDGRVIYLGEADAVVESIDAARPLDAEAAETALALAQSSTAVFVNPYLIEVEGRAPAGRDRLKAVSYTHLDVYKRQRAPPVACNSVSS